MNQLVAVGRRVQKLHVATVCAALVSVMIWTGTVLAETVVVETTHQGDLREVSPTEDAYAEDRVMARPPVDRLVGVVLSLGSAMINTVFFPVKLVVGVAGAEVGGAAGLMAGGDTEAAAGIWNVTTDGSYFVTPARLDGRDCFTWGGDSR